MHRLPFFILLAFSLNVFAWNSALLEVKDNTLVYHADKDGFVLPDFSHAGYMGADHDLPFVPTVSTISPIKGDNTAYLQAAIDALGTLPLNNGIRGALLLTSGTYIIEGTINIPYDGVVLRGETDAVLYATGDTPHQRDVLVVGASKRIWGQTEQKNTRQLITDNIVPAGAMSFSVQDASAFSVGNQIIIYHPCSAQWLAAINYGGVPYPDPTAPNDPDERWTIDSYPITYHRYITAINGNTITIDAPVFYTLNRSLSQSYIYIPNMSGTIYNSGIENITIEIESAGGEDENHAWNAVRFRSIENAWAIGCTFIGFGQSGIVTEACRRSTFSHCNALDPVGITTGERKYNFNTYLHSQLNLFSKCYARAGRHNYISNGTSGTSGNVFLNCISDGALNVNEGHRSWTQGMLYDNHQDINMTRPFTLGLYNRVAMGTGHGWAAVQSVLWNCNVDATYGTIGLQQPPTSQNYAIGCQAKKITGNPVNASNFTIGYVEGQNKSNLQPQSLYLAQLAVRHGTFTADNSPTANIISTAIIVSQNEITALTNIDSLLLLTPDGKTLLKADNLHINQTLLLPQATNGIIIAHITTDNTTLTQKLTLYN